MINNVIDFPTDPDLKYMVPEDVPEHDPLQELKTSVKRLEAIVKEWNFDDKTD